MKAQKLIDIVSKGEVDQAIYLLKKAIRKHKLGKKLYAEATLLHFRLNQIQEDMMLGFVTMEQKQCGRNKIVFTLINLIFRYKKNTNSSTEYNLVYFRASPKNYTSKSLKIKEIDILLFTNIQFSSIK